MKLQTLILVAALAGAGAGVAYAQEGGGGGGGGGGGADMQAARAAMMQACASDLSSLCAGKQGREANMCLRDNTDKLSPGCKDAMSKMPARPAGPPQG
jgi:hypothetical protein